MKTKLIGLFITVITLSAFTTFDDKGKIVKVEVFKKMIDTIGLTFDMPEGYKETYVKENGDLYYAFAIKNTKEDFEVRYSIWSLKPDFEEYRKCKLDSTHCVMVNPNNNYQGRAEANVLNMTAGQNANIGAFPSGAVKEEFNADAGGSSFFVLNCEFGKGYKYGHMVYLHKDGIADVIITYLDNDKSKHSELMDVPFHSLKFK